MKCLADDASWRKDLRDEHYRIRRIQPAREEAREVTREGVREGGRVLVWRTPFGWLTN